MSVIASKNELIKRTFIINLSSEKKGKQVKHISFDLSVHLFSSAKGVTFCIANQYYRPFEIWASSFTPLIADEPAFHRLLIQQ